MSDSSKPRHKPETKPIVSRRFLVILNILILFLIVNLGFMIYVLSDKPSGSIHLELTGTHMMPNPTVEALLHQTETAAATIARTMTETAEAHLTEAEQSTSQP